MNALSAFIVGFLAGTPVHDKRNQRVCRGYQRFPLTHYRERYSQMNAPQLSGMTTRQEVIIRGEGPPTLELAPGISIREFASGRIGAIGLSTSIARLAPGAHLPYHVHPCGESVAVLKGKLESAIEGRTYHLLPFDCIHIPAGVPHSAKNIENECELILHNTFSSAEVSRTPVNTVFAHQDRSHLLAEPDAPESLRRLSLGEEYELSKNVLLRDLFAHRFGSTGISGQLGLFSPGARLPWQTSQFDGSVSASWLDGSMT